MSDRLSIVQQKSLEFAIQQYETGKVSLGKAVEIADTDYWTFLDILHQNKIPLNLDEIGLTEDIKRIEAGEYDKYLKKEHRKENE